MRCNVRLLALEPFIDTLLAEDMPAAEPHRRSRWLVTDRAYLQRFRVQGLGFRVQGSGFRV